MISIRVITNAKRTEVVEEKEGVLKIKLKAVPVDGKANDELIKFLAQRYDVAKSQVVIIKGLTNQQKLVKIIDNQS